MRGWAHLWAAADIIRPAMVVIDPALDAYTGDPNNLAAVREFVSALGAEAAARSCGVLLVAHSRKAARGKDSDPFDPGQVGGVGAWADAARGVLTLTGQGDNRTLAIAKANWGRAFVPGAARAGHDRWRRAGRIRHAGRLDGQEAGRQAAEGRRL